MILLKWAASQDYFYPAERLPTTVVCWQSFQILQKRIENALLQSLYKIINPASAKIS